MKIQTFTHNLTDIELTYHKGKMAYSFTKNGSVYGISVEVKSRSIEDVMSATFQLLQNAVETINKLNK